MKRKKSEDIASEIRKLINTEEYIDGTRLPPERTLAKKLGTTQLTINKAISMLQAEGLVDKRHGSGNYALRKSRFKTVCFLVEEIGRTPNPIWYSAYEAFHILAMSKAINVRLCIIPHNCFNITKNHFDPSDLLVAALALNPERVASISSHKIPVIWLEEYEEPLVGPSIYFDNFEAGRMAADFMIRKGCRKFLYVTFSMAKASSKYGDFTSDRRFDGLRRGIVELGKGECSVQYYSCIGDFEKFTPELKPYFETKGMIDGVLAFSDRIAFYAIKAALEAGRKIPEELAVMGIDGLPWGEFQRPSLTSIRQPINEIGLKAFEVANQIFSGNEVDKAIRIKPEIIIRESTSFGGGLKKAVNI
ncbi:MAG TPA: hypothetical protein DCZ94_21865 [Lentisphaeria bacterium]|nr:MAG: hypothetical protein A2X48_19290 [Lentisphaerae bacterium GWF2_49_21]HBC89593.1 hypothetical protein [Lentisphaeria bacterium]